jgi:hypothetical protein
VQANLLGFILLNNILLNNKPLSFCSQYRYGNLCSKRWLLSIDCDWARLFYWTPRVLCGSSSSGV